MIATIFGVLCIIGALIAGGIAFLALGFASEPSAPAGLVWMPTAVCVLLGLAGIGLITGW